MEFSYPLPKQSEVHGQFSDKWSDFMSRFRCHQNQNGTTNDSFLLHFGSKTINKMHEANQLSFEHLGKLSSLIESVEYECLFKIILCFMRYLFFNHYRKAGARAEDFYIELKLLSEFCSFDGTIDNFIKSHIINSLPEMNVREVFTNVTSLTARDVVDVISNIERHGDPLTPELCHAYLMEHQQKAFQTSNKIRKDYGWSSCQGATLEINKGLNLSTVFRGDHIHCPSDAGKTCFVENGLKYNSYSSLSFPPLETVSDLTSYIPHKIPSLGVNFHQSSDGMSGFLQPPTATTLCPSYQEVSSTMSAIPLVSTPSISQHFGASPVAERPKPKAKKAQLKPLVNQMITTVTSLNVPHSIINTSKSKDPSPKTHSTSDKTSCEEFTVTATMSSSATTTSTTVTTTSSRSAFDPVDGLDISASVDGENSEETSNFADTSEACPGERTTISPSMASQVPEENDNEIPQSYCSQQKAMLKTGQVMEGSGQAVDIFTCNFCVFNCPGRSNMKEHVLKEHQSLKCFVCTACYAKFPSREPLESHVRSKHLNVEEYRCQICDMVFITQKNLFSHLQGHAETQAVLCRVCSAMFHTEKLLSDHMAKVHPDSDRWVCRVCNASFSTRRTLVGHMAKVHKDNDNQDRIRRFMCKLCGIRFKDKKSSEMHKRKYHRNPRARRFPCDVCPHVCTSNANLISHRRIHTGEKPYMCEVCGKEFAQISTLGKHTRIHTGEKPYKCRYCDLSFAASSNRLMHERVHRKERPYICEQCGKTFRNSYELKMHIDTHNEFRPRRFLCHCGAAFDTRRKLRRHEVCHSGRKPYKCEVCGASFTRPENVKGHQKSRACLKRASKLDC